MFRLPILMPYEHHRVMGLLYVECFLLDPLVRSLLYCMYWFVCYRYCMYSVCCTAVLLYRVECTGRLLLTLRV
jgi:hypothetical protein